MGWWSVDIMGGDTPLDLEDTLYELMGVEKYPENGDMNPLNKEGFTEEVFEKYITKSQEWGDTVIGMQVLAWSMIKVGAPINDSLKELMVTALGDDEWAKEDNERKAVTEGFKKVLENYDGTPVPLETKGLFEIIAEGEGIKTKQYKTFSLQLNNLTDEQTNEVEERLIKLAEELERKYDTTGGDFIGIESGVI